MKAKNSMSLSPFEVGMFIIAEYLSVLYLDFMNYKVIGVFGLQISFRNGMIKSLVMTMLLLRLSSPIHLVIKQ